MERVDAAVETENSERAVFGKVIRRIVPFTFVLYLVAYLDRVNVSFAALQMKPDLAFSDAVYGFGAGIFFVGYFLFEIPSNLILERVGARLWIARIMVTWGIISCCTMFVRTPMEFYGVRFLLGLAEAGFFPGILLYFTYWFPPSLQAKIVALFMTAVAFSGVVGGPLSGLLLTLHAPLGLHGWQLLFLCEGIPSIILGVVVFFFMADNPEKAPWLTRFERETIVTAIRREREAYKDHNRATIFQALASPMLWLFSVIYFLLVLGLYGLTMWLPLFLKSLSHGSDARVAMLTTIPYLVGAVAMVLWARHSDVRGERAGHVAVSAFAGAIGLAVAAYMHHPVGALIAFCVAVSGIYGTFGPFWAMPSSVLTGSAAAGGLALINSIGNLGGFWGPYLNGALQRHAHDYRPGILCMSGAMLLAGILVLLLARFSSARSAFTGGASAAVSNNG